MSPLPPLSLEYVGARDWHRPCEVYDCEDGRISPTEVIAIRDRLGAKYCRSCALNTDPELTGLAIALEQTWQLILAGRETPHFHDVAPALHAMAAAAEAVELGALHVHTRVRVDEQTATTVHAARHTGWEPPYPEWPIGDDEPEDDPEHISD